MHLVTPATAVVRKRKRPPQTQPSTSVSDVKSRTKERTKDTRTRSERQIGIARPRKKPRRGKDSIGARLNSRSTARKQTQSDGEAIGITAVKPGARKTKAKISASSVALPRRRAKPGPKPRSNPALKPNEPKPKRKPEPKRKPRQKVKPQTKAKTKTKPSVRGSKSNTNTSTRIGPATSRSKKRARGPKKAESRPTSADYNFSDSD